MFIKLDNNINTGIIKTIYGKYKKPESMPKRRVI